MARENKFAKLRLDLLDVDMFVKENELVPVTDPLFFNGEKPTSAGLLSNEIFGISTQERSGVYSYIDLGEYFISPLAYSAMCKLNTKIPAIIAGNDKFSISEKGILTPDENGNTGLKWFYKNYDKVNWSDNAKSNRKIKIAFLKKCRKQIWINKFPIIPAFYRDVNTKTSGSIGVGEINKLYASLLTTVNSLKSISEYGLDISESVRVRIQNIINQIFDWFGGGTTINGQPTSGNIPGKNGLIKKASLYKTVDYSTGLVMTAANINVESYEDMMCTTDRAELPLASAIVNFKPFIEFWLRRFFEQQFVGRSYINFEYKDKVLELPLKDYMLMYNDEEYSKQIERFVHGYSNRLIPLKVPLDMDRVIPILKENNVPIKELDQYLEFKFRATPESEPQKRRLTWCDLFYRAAVEMTEDKYVMATRFPIDSYLNQLPTKFNISSTTKTESLYIESDLSGGYEFHKWYPYIRDDIIGSNTSSLFKDSFSVSDALIDAMGMDYDGDTSTLKPVYTVEANEELREHMENGLVQLIGMDGTSARKVTKENIVLLYTLTNQPDRDIKLVDPIF